MKKENRRYLVACSGGPDSMALLDMSFKKFRYIEVAHVNYHKRDTALRDEKIVRKYCKKNNIKFNKLNVYPEEVKGNFQAYARIKRYEYFYRICRLHKLEAVLVAHHMDDNIETYLMQTDKKLGVNYYGLAYMTNLYGVDVIRPLLNFTKSELVDYCNENLISFGIDESNLSNDYTRNKIRHEKVEHLTKKQKLKIVDKINKLNQDNQKKIKDAISYLNDEGIYETDYFLNIPNIKNVIRIFIPGKSDRYYNEMLRQLKESKSCVFKNDRFCISKEYNHINMFMIPKEYSYTFNSLEEMKSKKYNYFSIRRKGSNKQGVTVSNNDFPITIRNCNKDDYITMKYGKKKLNRFFIDNKIFLKDRLSWPVIINRKGNAILVPEIGCDIEHYSTNHSFFVLKLN